MREQHQHRRQARDDDDYLFEQIEQQVGSVFDRELQLRARKQAEQAQIPHAPTALNWRTPMRQMLTNANQLTRSHADCAARIKPACSSETPPRRISDGAHSM